MRTTLDIPDDLFRQLKIRAASEGKTLKTLLFEIIARGTNTSSSPPAKSNIRTIPFSGTIRGPGGPAMKDLNNEKIEELLNEP